MVAVPRSGSWCDIYIVSNPISFRRGNVPRKRPSKWSLRLNCISEGAASTIWSPLNRIFFFKSPKHRCSGAWPGVSMAVRCQLPTERTSPSLSTLTCGRAGWRTCMMYSSVSRNSSQQVSSASHQPIARAKSRQNSSSTCGNAPWYTQRPPCFIK